jgi:hypothetical protein
VSRQLRSLAIDHEVWKRKYIDTYGLRRHRILLSAWRKEEAIDWKARYKTKTNWRNGRARLHQKEIATPPSPPVVAKVHRGLVFTCDRYGLRVWRQHHDERVLLAHKDLTQSAKVNCIAAEGERDTISALLGFEDGSCSIYEYRQSQLSLRIRHQSDDGPLVAVSLAWPYAMTVSKTRFLTLYKLEDGPELHIAPTARLQSDATLAPLSVTLRRNTGQVIAAIAYAFERLRAGWCLGVQELRLTEHGSILESRLASTLETPRDQQKCRQRRWDTRFTSSNPLPLHPAVMSPPTSLSYEHPFLVCSLPDNTIMSFLVVSTDTMLDISSGRRLWGHTSAVTGAEVNNRGKAVSISSRGNELRVWNLEAAMATRYQGSTSTQVKAIEGMATLTPALVRRGSGLGLAFHEMRATQELDEHVRRWVGFDDEQVVVLGETRDRRQIMALYDFT